MWTSTNGFRQWVHSPPPNSPRVSITALLLSFPFWEDNGNGLLVFCYSLGLLARHLLPNCSILCSTGNVAKVTLIPFRLCVFACECVHNTPWNVPEDTTRDRFVWDLILWFSKQSMESMPALCASVWIMMNGPLPLNGADKECFLCNSASTKQLRFLSQESLPEPGTEFLSTLAPDLYS